MGALSIWHVLIVAAAALLLFGGRGKISDIMGDVGKGIKSFKLGLTEPDAPPSASQIAPKGEGAIGDAVPAQASDR